MTEPEFNPDTWEITVYDNKGRAHRYTIGNPLPYRKSTEAEISAAGKVVLESASLKDEILAGRPPEDFSVACAFGASGLEGNWRYFECVLCDSERLNQ